MDKLKRKIGVMTFWTSNTNYGQILQGYALQHFLKQNGFESYIIRFDSLLSNLLATVRLGIKGNWNHFRQTKYRKFYLFKRNFIKYSVDYYYSFSKLQKKPPVCDVLITGSDQVWTFMNNIERRKAYLLQFGLPNTKKIAYATSFGRNALHESEKDFYQYSLKRFSFVGVREKTGLTICNNLDITAEWVVDPVLLLEKSKWKAIATNIVIQDNSRKNVFIYTLSNSNMNKNIHSMITYLKRNCNIYYTNSDMQVDTLANVFPTIQEWIGYINQCDYVITDSFHCTVFCVLFNKPFTTIARVSGMEMNDRLVSFLTRISLENRYLSICEDNNIILQEHIDWENINREIKDWKENSIMLLLKTL